MQIIRSTFLAVLCAALAWPLAWVYREPQLGPLLLVGAFQLLLNGFHSTSLYTLRRRVASGSARPARGRGPGGGHHRHRRSGRCSHRSVWALVAGAVAGTVTQLVASHFLPVGYRNRFGWDREIRNEIIRFGRWILASSAVFFFARQADRLLLGRFMGPAVLGVYGIAGMISEAVGTVSDRITAGVLYPIFSRLGAGNLPELKAVYYRTRLRMDAAVAAAAGRADHLRRRPHPFAVGRPLRGGRLDVAHPGGAGGPGLHLHPLRDLPDGGRQPPLRLLPQPGQGHRRRGRHPHRLQASRGCPA